MKKIYAIISMFMIFCSFAFFVACGETNSDVSFVFEQQSYTIDWEDGAENKLIIYATTSSKREVDYNLYYKNSDLKINGEYLADGKYSFTILPIQKFSNSVVKFSIDGGLATSITITCASTLSQINLKSSTTFIYGGDKKVYDLNQKLLTADSFVPSDTLQTNVEFQIVDIFDGDNSVKDTYLSKFQINNNELIIESGLDKLPLKLKIIAKSLDKQDIISAPCTVELVSAIKEENFEIKVNGETLNDNKYNFTISNGEIIGGFKLDISYNVTGADKHNILIDIMFVNGIFDVKSSVEQEDTMGCLTSKTFTLVPSANYNGNGEDEIWFKITYVDFEEEFELYPVAGKDTNNETIYKKIEVATSVKISSIRMFKEGNLVENESTINFFTYSNVEELYFSAYPSYTNQKELSFSADEDFFKNFSISKSKDLKECLTNKFDFNSDELLYIKLKDEATNDAEFKITVSSKVATDIYSSYTFRTNIGVQNMSVVEERGDSFNDIINPTIYLENGTNVNTNSTDLKILIKPASFDISLLNYSYQNVTLGNIERYKEVKDGLTVTGYVYKLNVTAHQGFSGEEVLIITTPNGISSMIKVIMFSKITDVNISTKTNPELSNAVGDYSYNDNLEIEYLAIKRFSSIELEYTPNCDSEITDVKAYFYDESIPPDGPYSDDYINFGKKGNKYALMDFINGKTLTTTSSILNAQNLAMSKILSAEKEGKVIIYFDFYGKQINAGQYVENIVKSKCLLVEVYTPITEINVSESSINLYAKNDLFSGQYDMAEKTVQISLNDDATYKQLLIDGQIISSESPRITDNYSIEKIDDGLYKFTLLDAYENILGQKRLINTKINIYAMDLKTDILSEIYNSNAKYIYRNTVSLIAMEAVKVSNIELYNVPVKDGNYEIYLDVDKNNTFTIQTNILPLNALNKNLEFIYQPNSQNDQNILSIINGQVNVTGTKGGQGKIIIIPQDRVIIDADTGIKTFKYDVDENGNFVLGNWYKEINVVVADGFSRDTAFRISTLDQINNANLHYILLNSCDLNDQYILNEEFNGGLYGRVKDDKSAISTIFTNHTLFDLLGPNAIISEINIVGKGTDCAIVGNAIVANVNYGIINNVTVSNTTRSVMVGGVIKSITVVTTLRIDGGYVYSGEKYAGGLVALNNGTIQNSIFAGAISEALSNDIYVGALIGYNTSNAQIENTYVHIYNLRTSYNALGEGQYSRNSVITKAYTSKGLTYEINFGTEESPESITYTIISYNNKEGLNANDFIKSYKDDDVKVSSAQLNSIYVKKSDNSLDSSANEQYGILMYYQADTQYSLSAIENSELSRRNSIEISSIIGVEGIDEALLQKITLKSGNSNLLNLTGNTVNIYGRGELSLEVTSRFDESVARTIKILIINYSKELTLQSNGYDINTGSAIYTRDNTSVKIQSSANTSIILYNRPINLKVEDFSVSFSDGNTIGTKLGSHIIPVSFGNNDTKNVVVSLNLFAEKISLLPDGDTDKETLQAFDSILSNAFSKSFNIVKIYGATDLEIIKTDICIEPKDVVVVSATLKTDINTEKLKIQILGEERQGDYTDCFEFFDGTSYSDNNIITGGSLNNNSKQFEIKFRLKDTCKSLKGQFLALITVDSSFDTGVSVEFDLTITPQKISNINATLYNTQIVNGKYKLSNQTSVLSTNDSNNTGILMVNLYPNYSDYDYIKITSHSNTSNYPLSLRLYKKEGSLFVPANDKEFLFIDNGNGLVVFKQENANSINVGIYYIKIYVNANVVQNTIYNIDIVPYLNDQPLDVSTIFTLYIKPQQKAGITFNGEDHIYTTKGSEITANIMITSDQEIVSTTFSAIEDGATINKYTATILEQTEDTTKNVYGYKYYNLKIKINEQVFDEEIPTQSFRVGITTKRVLNGIETYVTSYAKVYVMDFILDKDLTTIDDIHGNTKYINNLISQKLDFNFVGTGNQDLIDKFNNEYYYYYNNEYIVNYIEDFTEEQYKTLGINGLIKNIYYQTSDNAKTPIYNDTISKFVDNEYLQFSIKDNELYVLGKQTGSVNLIYSMPIKYPDGSIYFFEYSFTLVVKPYSDYDKPTVILSNSDFLEIFNNQDADNYILMQDLYLYDFNPIENTEKIMSLDGNNKSINIISFNNSALAQSNIELALFKTISQNTTITNLTVNIFELNTISPSATDLSSIKIAGLALNNYGVIYNSEVVSYKSRNAVGYNGINLQLNSDKDIEIQMAGFVLNNSATGSITNSRVGGDSRKIINIIKNNNDETDITYTTQTIELSPFNISGYGDISGFVYQNEGTISSCFVKNVKIQNKSTFDNDLKNVTSGFVYQNDNTILLSYAEGVRSSSTEVHISKYGISTSGIATGFVYINNADIKDCYSNIKLTNDSEASGRFSAGFVYKNAETGSIKNAYSFSLIKNNSTTQTNFTGVDTWGVSQNFGQLSSCYYYSQSSVLNDTQALEEFYNTDVVALEKYNDLESFYGFAFDGNGEPTWQMSSVGPTIVSANKIAISVRYQVSINADTVFMYADGYALGSEKNPIIIRNAKEFNEVFGTSQRDPIAYNYNLTKKEVYGSYRLVNNIDLSDLLSSQGISQEDKTLYSLSSTSMSLTGEKYNLKTGVGYALFDGNGLTISNLALSDTSLGSATENFGLFKEIKSGACIKNLNVVVGVERRTSEGSETIYSGIDAKNANIVGAIAGTMSDSSAINLTVSGISANANVTVLGKNIVGAVFGRVIGESTLTNISAQNINVTASYNPTTNQNNKEQINRYTRSDNVKTNSMISIAGGVVGVYDRYLLAAKNQDYYSTSIETTASPSAITIKNSGVSQIYGGTAGGVFGFIGPQSFIQDVLYEIQKNTDSSSKIIAKSGFAGGIVGYNRGYIRMARAEHESAWQDEIEQNIPSYYQATAENVDRGQLDLFDDDNYIATAIGGIVGFSSAGKIEKSYSKINVISEHMSNGGSAGGIVGYYAEPNYVTNDKTANTALTLDEVYSFSDVYSKSYTAGIIGCASSSNISLTKVNAVNYWGIRDYSTSKLSLIINGINGNALKLDKEENVYTYSTTYQVGETEFKNTGIDSFNPDATAPNLTKMQNIVATGMQFDTIFRLKQWDSLCWHRDDDELLPHLVFGFKKGYFIIKESDDLILLERYGKQKDATFVIVGNNNNGMIDASGFNYTISDFQGKLIGYDSSGEYGIKGLKQPLFANATSASFANIKLQDCSSAFIKNGTSISMSGLQVVSTNTSRTVVNGSSALVETLNGKSHFDNISISNVNLKDAENAKNAENLGLLVGTIDKRAEVVIKQAHIAKCDITPSEQTRNAGLLIGNSDGTVTVSDVDVDGSIMSDNEIKIDINSEDIMKQVNIGGLIGRQDTNSLTLENIITSCYTKNINITSNLSEKNNTDLANIGGLVGYANNITAQGFILVKNKLDNKDNSSITISAKESNISTVFGYLSNFTSNGDILSNANMNINTQGDIFNFGGFAGKYIVTSTQVSAQSGESEQNATSASGAIIILGNQSITIEKQNNKNTSISNIGGVFGLTSGSSASVTLTNMVYAGNLQINGSVDTLYAGGLVGTIDTGSNNKISNSLSYGDIELQNDLLVDALNVGGLVGTSKNTVYQNCYSLTSIINKKAENIVNGYKKADNRSKYNVNALIGNNASTNAEGNPILETITDTYYSHVVNLCIDQNFVDNNITYSNILNDNDKIKSFTINEKSCKDIFSSFIGDNKLEENDIKKYYDTGSKINPDTNLPVGDMSKYESFVDNAGQKELSAPNSALDRYYYYLSDDKLYYTTKSIGLTNVAIVGDGAKIRVLNLGTETENCQIPFATINENSFVSGLVVQIYVGSNSRINPTNTYVGALANVNKGIIFGCNAQELNEEITQKLVSHYSNEIAEGANKLITNKEFIDVYEGLIYFNYNNVYIGGLVGENTGLVSHSFAKVNVKSNSSAGFVYENLGTISNCYSTGSAQKYAFAGNSGVCINSYTISPYTGTNSVFSNNSINCWADGYVTNCKKDLNGDIINNYQEKTTNDISLDFAKSNAESNSPSHGFQSVVWQYDITNNYGYPYIDFGANITYMNNCTITKIIINGEPETVITYYHIPNYGKFKQIAKKLDGKYIIIKDINALSENDNIETFDFAGEIDGKFSTINKLDINNYLFESNTGTGTVKNLSFVDLNLTITNDDSNVGLFATNSGTIKNVEIKSATITDKHGTSLSTIGLICAKNSGTVEDCQVGELKTGDKDGLFKDGLFLDYVKTSELVVGGIVGKNEGTAKLCVFNSSININNNLKFVTNREAYNINDNPGGVNAENKLRNVALGGIAGVNGGTISYSGITANCTLNAISIDEVDEVNEYDYYGNRNITEYSVAYVGGIAGINAIYNKIFATVSPDKTFTWRYNLQWDESMSSLGTIQYCYTYNNENHSLADDENQIINDESYEITAGSSMTQTLSYVAGIAGYGGNVSYSYNAKNVGASARTIRFDCYIDEGTYKTKYACYIMVDCVKQAYVSGIGNNSSCKNVINYAKVAGGDQHMYRPIAVILDESIGYVNYSWNSRTDIFWNIKMVWNYNVLAKGELYVYPLDNAGFEYGNKGKDSNELKAYLNSYYQIQDSDYKFIPDDPVNEPGLTKQQLKKFGGVWQNLIIKSVKYNRQTALNLIDISNCSINLTRNMSRLNAGLISTAPLPENGNSDYNNYTGTEEALYYYHIYDMDVKTEKMFMTNVFWEQITYKNNSNWDQALYSNKYLINEEITLQKLYGNIMLNEETNMNSKYWQLDPDNQLSKPYYVLKTEPASISDDEKNIINGAVGAENDVEITSEGQLRYIIHQINAETKDFASATYVLRNNISLSKPINPIKNFSGIIDGLNNYSITNINLINSDEENGQLAFIQNASGATIRNVTFGFNTSQTDEYENSYTYGGIIGTASGGVTIQNVTVNASNTITSNALDCYANFIGQISEGASVNITNCTLTSPTKDSIIQNTKAFITENGSKSESWKKSYTKTENSAIGGYVAVNNGTLNISNCSIGKYNLSAYTSIPNVGFVVGKNIGTIKINDEKTESTFKINNSKLSLHFNHNFNYNETTKEWEYGDSNIYVSALVANNAGTVTLNNQIDLFTEDKDICIEIDANEEKLTCNYASLCNGGNLNINNDDSTKVNIASQRAMVQIGYNSYKLFDKIIVCKTDSNKTNVTTDNMRYNLFAKSKQISNMNTIANTNENSKFDIDTSKFNNNMNLNMNKYATSGSSVINNDIIFGNRFSANYYSTYNTIPRTPIGSDIVINNEQHYNYELHTQYTIIQTTVTQINDYKIDKDGIPTDVSESYYSFYTDYIYVLDIYENNVNYGDFGFTYTLKLQSVLTYLMENTNTTQIALNARNDTTFKPKSGTFYEFNMTDIETLKTQAEKSNDKSEDTLFGITGDKETLTAETESQYIVENLNSPIMLYYGNNKNTYNKDKIDDVNISFYYQDDATITFDKETKKSKANVEEILLSYSPLLPVINYDSDSDKILLQLKSNVTISTMQYCYDETKGYIQDEAHPLIENEIPGEVILLNLSFPTQLNNPLSADIMNGKTFEYVEEDGVTKIEETDSDGLFESNNNQTQNVHIIKKSYGTVLKEEYSSPVNVDDNRNELDLDSYTFTPKSATENYNQDNKKFANYYIVTNKYSDGTNSYDIISYIKYINGAYQVTEHIFSQQYYLGDINYQVGDGADILSIVNGTRTVKFVPKSDDISNLVMNLTYKKIDKSYSPILGDLEIITYKTITTYTATVNDENYTQSITKATETQKITQKYTISYSYDGTDSKFEFTAQENIKESQESSEETVDIVTFINKWPSNTSINLVGLKIIGTEGTSNEFCVSKNNEDFKLTSNGEELSSSIEGCYTTEIDNNVFIINKSTLLVQKQIDNDTYEDYTNVAYKLEWTTSS